MFKIAKSRVVQLAEQKLREGDREGALALLRQAEAADRPGAFTAKEIKGLHDDPAGELGSGFFGTVRERFYGGQMLPSKELRLRQNVSPSGSPQFAYPQDMQLNIDEFSNEGRTNRRVADMFRTDPVLQRLGVRTPQYYGNNAHGMLGHTDADLREELPALQGVGAAATRQQRGRVKELTNRLAPRYDPERPPNMRDLYQVQPMTRLPQSTQFDELSPAEQRDMAQRFTQARQRAGAAFGYTDTDKTLEYDHNTRVGVPDSDGRRDLYLYDFGQSRFDPLMRAQTEAKQSPSPAATADHFRDLLARARAAQSPDDRRALLADARATAQGLRPGTIPNAPQPKQSVFGRLLGRLRSLNPFG